MRIDLSINHTLKESLTRMRYYGILVAYPEIVKELSDFKKIIEYLSTSIYKNQYDYYYLNWNVTKIANFVRDNYSLIV